MCILCPDITGVWRILEIVTIPLAFAPDSLHLYFMLGTRLYNLPLLCFYLMTRPFFFAVNLFGTTKVPSMCALGSHYFFKFKPVWNTEVESSGNVIGHGDAREGKWRGNWRMEWVASTLHTTSEHLVSSITTADAHTTVAISRFSWRPCWFKWNGPFRRKKKSGLCACAITFETQSAFLLLQHRIFNPDAVSNTESIS